MLRRLALPFFIVLLVLLALAVRAVPVSTDMSFFTPDRGGVVEDFLFRQMTRADGVAMIAVNGDDKDRVRTAADAVIERLESMKAVSRVLADGFSIDREARAFLMKHRYVLGPDLADGAFTTAHMSDRIADGLRKLGSGIGPVYRDIFPRDPTGRALRFVDRDDFLGPSGVGGSSWQNDPGRVPILALLNIGADDIPGHADIRRAVRDAAAEGGAGVSVAISGPGFFALGASERIRSEMRVLAALAAAGVAIVLFAAFRASMILVTIALPVAFGLLSGILVTAWLFGSVHGVAIAFGSVMIGVAVDYPVHLASFRRPGEDGHAVARRLFPVMALGAATTLAGFVIMSQSSFPGLAQIGTLTATAIIVAVLFSRWLLPLALPSRPLDIRPGRALWGRLHDRPGFRRVARYLCRAAPVLGIGAVIATGASVWDDDIRNLRMPNEAQVQIDRELRAGLGMPDVSHVVLVEGKSREDVMDAQWRVSGQLRDAVRDGRIGGYLSLTDVLPPVSVQTARIARIPDAAVLRDRLATATESLPVKAEVFRPFLRDIEAARQGGAVHADDPALRGLTLLMSYPVEAGDGWMNAIRLIPPIDAEALELEGAALINLRRMATEIVRDYRVEGLELLAIGALVGLLIVIVGRRGIRPALGVVAAPVTAVAVTATALILSGTPLSFFHLLALVLVVSIGIDYELFFAGYQEGPEAGEHSFSSVMLCFVSTFLVFAVLATSEIPMLHAIGVTVALGAAVSFLVTVMRADRKPVS